ncbi:RluA family pseudouridine synthase [Leptotrichia sp. oral taxon 218]|uniref:RluA family pseudouridine synthase n=1 Tax=Leptotrichia sp. oral taxon 218 TaxID=712361 RepID=UPI001B8B9914|nr:RluA family pseudouridine synthase [Leptotrichia sp. oral taxon 218]QUB95039.1 RluA family pseudouridine synthase [Leptotrichia sp. oral taxon 218]
MKKFRIEKEHQRMKISQYLREVQNYSGRSLRNVEVFLNGKQVRLTKKLPSHGNLKVVEKKKGTDIKPIKLPIDIVFEDEDILVVNKEPFLLTHPTQKKVDFTLANGVVNHFLEKYGEVRVPRFYNRLDMNTSGLIIIAKNSFAQAFLQNFSIFEKKYLAIVNGIIDDEEISRIKDELAKDGENHKIQDFEKENLKAEVEKVNFGKMKKYDEIEKIENNSNFENKDNKIGENINFDSKKENNNLNLESKSNFENINFKINKNIDFDSKNTKYNLNLKDKNDFNNEILEKNGTNKIIIERRIFRDGDNLERIIDERGQYAKTAVKVLKTYPEKNVTLVECELFTGRTHQIRVHLKSIGHTIVGDELYGTGLNKELGINRQFLHAYKVKFTHPASKEEVELEIPIFTDMKDFLEK